ncbi:MAG: hypothetical protein OER95_05790 [Acidimicrobiia bacterium]|nr:hypothetical protein [Acidimicrobiia bacterium]
MQRALSETALKLSYLVAVLAAVASAGGILIDGLYRDTEFVVSTWLGNDLVTLLVATPVLVGALVLTARGSARATLVWLGMLDYMLYNFGFYLFGAAFNWFFFIYVVVFALSIWALVMALMSLDVDQLAAGFDPLTPVRPITGFMAFVGIALPIIYFLQWLGFATSGEVPSIIEKSGHPTNIVFALDLSLVVPVMLVGAVLLWQRRGWGYALAAMANVKGAVYMLALSAATFTAFRAETVDSIAEVGLWLIIGVGSTIASVVLLHNLRLTHGRVPP